MMRDGRRAGTGSRALLTALALLALAGCQGMVGPPGPQEGSPAPGFALASLDGPEVELASLAGRPLVLNFWATWCGPCRHEIPHLRRLAAEDGVQVVSINLDAGGGPALRDFVERHGINYPVLLGDGEVVREYGAWAIPYTLVLDASQKIVRIYRGTVSRHTLVGALEKAARES